MYDLENIQYYINNDCNLSCHNCISYNNFNYRGYYKWQDYENKNKIWPRYINPGQISILGGEPYLNPDLINWAHGVRSIWPEHNFITLATNGTLLDRNKVKNTTKQILNLGIQIEISVHDKNQHSKITEDFFQILREEDIIFDVEDIWDDYTAAYDKQRIRRSETGEVLGTIASAYMFENISVNTVGETINFYSSDPDKAHDVCLARECHYILNGDLYKCVVVSTAKEFSNQYTLDSRSKSLLDQYKPCDPLSGEEEINKFLDAIKKTIPQCSLCPSKKIRVNAL